MKNMIREVTCIIVCVAVKSLTMNLIICYYHVRCHTLFSSNNNIDQFTCCLLVMDTGREAEGEIDRERSPAAPEGLTREAEGNGQGGDAQPWATPIGQNICVTDGMGRHRSRAGQSRSDRSLSPAVRATRALVHDALAGTQVLMQMHRLQQLLRR